MSQAALLHLPATSLAIVLIFLFVAGTTKGLIGVGMPIVAVPLLTLIVDMPLVVVLLAIPLIITNIPQALVGDKLSIVLRRLTPIFGGMFVGVVIGVGLLTTLDPTLLKLIVGIILLLVAMLMIFSPSMVIPPKIEPVASPLAGLVGGIAGGLAALPGPFVFMYLLACGIQRDRFVQYSSMFLTVSACVMTIALGAGGVLRPTDALISTAAALPIFLGMWMGSYMRQLVSIEVFRKLILGVVMVSGFHLILPPGALRAFGVLMPALMAFSSSPQ